MILNESNYLLFFSNCIPVDGYLRSVIYDLSRSNYNFIPKRLSKLMVYKNCIQILEFKSIILEKYDSETVYSYLRFLLENEYATVINSNKSKLFPKLELTWDYPSCISNLIIDFHFKDNSESYLFKKIIEGLNIFHLAVIADKFDRKLSYMFNSFLDSCLREIDLIIEDSDVKLSTVKRFCNEHHRVNSVYLKGVDGQIERTKTCTIFFSSNKENKNNKFSINVQLFTESQKHHTYFNRKLYIGKNGEIKNAPECEEVFGYIQDIKDVADLKQVISTPEFQKYWFVHKELCDVCKDCEFRHMCVDNRLPYQRKDGSWYHKIECNYNPYICKWKGEDGYKTLEECGIIVDENGFNINHKKISAINTFLWEEETENA